MYRGFGAYSQRLVYARLAVVVREILLEPLERDRVGQGVVD